MIYQDPLAYLLGLEGVALLDGWAGDHDREFTEARLAEIRRLLDDANLKDKGVLVHETDAATAYHSQAPDYDENAGGGLFALDEPIVAEFLADRAPGVALDAACGTGRFSELLAARGHRVIGVDASPDMLAIAAKRVPDGEFHVGELDHIPLGDASVDVIVCALALVHVKELAPVLAEFARVLRPGGEVIVSDVHHDLVLRGSAIKGFGPNGEPQLAPTYRHPIGSYLRAALDAGLQVIDCREPGFVEPTTPPPAATTEIGDWEVWPWSLMAYAPEAMRAATRHPHLVLWHFRKP